ncbi:MAG: T9SS type A sorting domain-containing protein [Flavipsychrobacter sp.]|nr:T9SS type A sorting domain-containing protein [Flavipsychrobacter sp.]
MKRVLSLLALLPFCSALLAQDAQHHPCAEKRINSGTIPHLLAKSTNLVPEEDYYDIKHLALNFRLTDTSIYVQGDAKTTAQVVVPTMSVYAFELDSMLTIDSIILNGQYHLTSTNVGYIRHANLPVTLQQGDMFDVHIYYNGTPPTGTGFFTGIMHSTGAGPTDMVYTVSDPYATKDWWPAKQSLQDKIDSVDMRVTVPEYCKAGSNGLLQSVTPADAGHVLYHWKTRYPIDYYLISLAIARYSEKQWYMHFDNSTDSMLIQNYFYDSTNFVTNYGANFDSVEHMVNYFSSLFGRYPFWEEKYGHCFTTLGGGMEHQTMTTIGVTDTRTIAHELCHQWFGDNVTYNQWEDVWLSEGFATYAEQLFLEHWWGDAPMKTLRTQQYNNVMSQLGGTVIVTDTTTITSLFNTRLVYRKGAAVAHMLRFVANNDSLYFAGLRNFQAAHAYGMATSNDLKNAMAATLNTNLDTFFNQWVYGEGYPRYTVGWSQAGPDVVVTLNQTTSMQTSVPLFHTPLEIKLKSPMGDTIVRVYNHQPQQSYQFTFSNWMNGVEIDPNNHILDKVLSTTNINDVAAAAKVRIAPNPTTGEWQAEGLEPGQKLVLTDMAGRTVWTGKSNGHATIIPGSGLPAGNYLLQVGDINKGTIQLTRL